MESIDINENLKIIPSKINPIFAYVNVNDDDDIPKEIPDEMRCFLTGTRLKMEDERKLSKVQTREIEDKIAWKHFEENVRVKDKRISVKFPIKSNVQSIDNNLNKSFGCLKGILKSLEQKKELLGIYDRTMREQIEMGILEHCPRQNHPFFTYYIPHHFVLKMSSSTTKLRIVLNASSKSKNSQSLNDILYQGAKIIPNVLGMLLRIRLSEVFIMGDVEKAFHQIELDESQRDLTRMLWVRDVTKEAYGNNVMYLRFTRIPFGVNCSPFLLGAGIAYFLERKDQDIFREILKNIYVDNIILNGMKRSEILDKYKTIKESFQEIGMNVREFYTNDTHSMQQIPEKERIKDNHFKILGLNYESSTDSFNIRIPTWTEKTITRRTILSYINSIFDPLGFTSPIVVRLKLFLKKVWEVKTEWDCELNDELKREWNGLKEKIESQKLCFKRNIMKESTEEKEILLFTDASKDVIAAVAYIVFRKDKKVEAIEFLCAKTSTMVEGSIPMKELSALLFGMKMIEEIVKEIDTAIEKINIFTDSQVVLCWLRKNPTKKVYVRNRLEKIKKIQESFENITVKFFYVNTKNNPADLPTRGVAEINENYYEWLAGLIWYKNEEEYRSIVKTQLEVMSIKEDEIDNKIINLLISKQVTQKENNDLDYLAQRYSSYPKFINVARNIFLFKARICKKTNIDVETLNWKLMNADTVIKQNKICVRMLIAIHQEQNISKLENQRYKSLDVIKDNEGILRVRGRLGHVNKSESEHPILLFGNKFFTNLLLKYIHDISLHAPRETLISIVRKEFFIIKLKKCLNDITSNCLQCKKINNRPFKYPNFPQLPKERVVKFKPFENIGIDYAGPLLVKTEEQTTKKVWIVLITCLCTRAVYLEEVTDCSSETLILTLRKFFARKRIPSKIISDNGSQFLKTDKILQSFCFEKNIEWRTITPYSPWKGGFYERLIGITKTYLIKTLGLKRVSIRELAVILVEIENLMNNRPIACIDNEFEKIITLKC
ncbi:unnamed protein product [Auanema sp. JU1783]|nr:unnamed protein product [Auanema sp. JU1783]